MADEHYYRKHVFCCVNERPEGHPRGCCKEKASFALTNYLKACAKEMGLDDIRINKSLCLDRCELGPVLVVYPEGVWYHYDNNDDLDEILETHLRDGQIVERLRLHHDQKEL